MGLDFDIKLLVLIRSFLLKDSFHAIKDIY